jgi:PKD repeat protein
MNTQSNFPNALDNDANLFLVRDALKLTLAYDYYPGQQILYVDGPKSTFDKFPETGTVTLSDQVSDRNHRAISFYYGGKSKMMFTDIVLISGKDCYKPKIETTVSQHVMAIHRNALKEAILSIEHFLGAKKTNDAEPLGSTIIGRLNYLRRIIFSPKAWFTASSNVGIAPSVIAFTAEAASADGGNATYEWDFGDGSKQTTPEPQIRKTYNKPGIHDVTLKITNDFGSDTVNFPKMVKVKAQSPVRAAIEFIALPGQMLSEKGILRTPVNQPVTAKVKEGRHANKTFAGEMLNEEGKAVDPIVKYTWNLSDDLSHNNDHTTRAVYSVGGVYDLNLRTDTEYGSYRITNIEKCIDVVEDVNLWLWTFAAHNNVEVSEFGLFCETFKTKPATRLNLYANSSFLGNDAIKEFKRNNGFGKRNDTSGKGGTCLICWATGRSPGEPSSAEKIGIREYNGFADVYTAHPAIYRPWNWAMLASDTNFYFAFGQNEGIKNKQLKTTLNFANLSSTHEPLVFANYKGNAQELMVNEPFSIYRTAWKGDTGYILRSKQGEFVNLRSFYKTEGTIGDPLRVFSKLPDMQGLNKTEGQLVALSRGIYCFDNSGAISIYNDNTESWEVSDTSAIVNSFRALQDHKATGHDKESNTLVATSDSYDKAYLSFDYSPNAFLKFNETDLSFHTLGHRPEKEQWMMRIY